MCINNNISFRSSICPTSLSKYTEASGDVYMNSNINYPWTYRETIKAPKVMTTDIYDCSAGGIVDEDTKEVTMFHLCPEQAQNKDFESVEKFIMSKVGEGKKNLRAFIIGSKKMFPDSEMLFNKLTRMMAVHNIPTTIIKGNKDDKTHILYDSKEDKWLITNNSINQKIFKGETDSNKILRECFDEVRIHEGDVVA